MPYYRLSSLEDFKKVRFEDKAIYWDTDKPLVETSVPPRLTVDSILFSIRDS